MLEIFLIFYLMPLEEAYDGNLGRKDKTNT